MGSFVLLLSGGVAEGTSARELGGRTARQAKWVAGLRDDGVLCDGGRIEDGSVRVRATGGSAAVIDLPADVLGAVRSWLLVDAVDLDSAVALASSCPEAAYGEVRVLRVDG